MPDIASPANVLGYDAYVRFGAMDPLGRDATGEELVTNAIIDRLTIGNLPLVEAPDGEVEFGDDVRLWVGEAMTDDSFPAKGARLAAVLQREPRLEPSTIRCVVTRAVATLPDYDLTIAITAETTNARPINLVLGINDVTVALLSQGT